jgi:SPP1 gp7 family putative phage head morphogenesis protein
LNALVADLETMPFSPQRARLIATTEVTRAFAQGKNIAWRRTGVVERRRWHTGNDELVCEVCQRLDGREVGLDEPFDDVGRIMYPPAHPRCRCTVQPVIPVSSPVSTDYTSPGLRDPVITFSNRRNQDDDRLSLSGIPFRQAPAAAWGKIPDRALPSEPYDLPPLTPTARRRGVGVLVVEEDGRVWVVKTDDDDMYEIPTVAVPKGLTLQQTALWHAYQATGLIVDLVDYVVDSPVDGIVTRYYVAKRRAGAPWGARSKRWVSLATTRHAASYANRMADRNILRQF